MALSGLFATCLLLAGPLAFTCSRAAESKTDSPASTAVVSTGAGGTSNVRLPTEAAARMGLSLTVAAPARYDGVREAYGRVLDALPFSEQLAAREAARATLAQIRSEYDRVLALHRLDQNTSKREVELAKLSLRRTEIELEAAQDRLRFEWGDSLADREDLPALVRRLSERRAAVARIEVLAGEPASGAPTLGAVSLATSRASVAGVTLLGAAPTTDPHTQGQGFLVLIEQAPPAPGTALVAHLLFPEETRTGVRVARSSVVWLDGLAYVWVEVGSDTYQRRPVTFAASPEAGLIVTGIEPGARVVVSGAQSLLSEELLAGRDPE